MVNVRNRFSRRVAAVFLSVLFLMVAALSSAAAEESAVVVSNEDGSPLTAAQENLNSYISRVNSILQLKGSRKINVVYECVKSFAVVGISDDGGEIPEAMNGQLPVEITFQMSDDEITSVEVHSEKVSEFSSLCAAMINAANPQVEYDDAFSAANFYSKKAISAPSRSFDSTVDLTRGDSLRCYYSYFPNQYMDGTNWIQMTMVFPLPGYSGAALTPPPQSSVRYQGEASDDYEGYGFDGSDYHYEIFTSPTPEPEIDFSKR